MNDDRTNRPHFNVNDPSFQHYQQKPKRDYLKIRAKDLLVVFFILALIPSIPLIVSFFENIFRGMDTFVVGLSDSVNSMMSSGHRNDSEEYRLGRLCVFFIAIAGILRLLLQYKRK